MVLTPVSFAEVRVLWIRLVAVMDLDVGEGIDYAVTAVSIPPQTARPAILELGRPSSRVLDPIVRAQLAIVAHVGCHPDYGIVKESGYPDVAFVAIGPAVVICKRRGDRKGKYGDRDYKTNANRLPDAISDARHGPLWRLDVQPTLTSVSSVRQKRDPLLVDPPHYAGHQKG